jgi:hypothetical protein
MMSGIPRNRHRAAPANSHWPTRHDPLTVTEIARLVSQTAAPRGHAVYWLTWRRRHQA